MIDKMIEEIKVMISEEINDSTILGASITDSIYDRIDEIAEKYKLQEQKWISVDERLPEDDANVLAFIKYVMVDGTCVGEENTMCDVTWYNPSSKRWFLPGLKEAEVKAWMPLPEYHFAEADKKVGGAECQ